jgi:glycosyltransferase involved in cell wall biosynthesis
MSDRSKALVRKVQRDIRGASKKARDATTATAGRVAAKLRRPVVDPAQHPRRIRPAEERLQVLIIAYACEPGAGSEEGVGWMWAKAAAKFADVILLIHPFRRELIEETIEREGLSMRVECVEPRIPRSIATRRWGGYFYYCMWQRSARTRIRALEREQRVDVVHHLTWASDSLPSALLASEAPVRIWGPVGGATRTAAPLYRYLHWRGKAEQLLRDVVNETNRRLAGDRIARHASLVVAINDDVAARFGRWDTPIIVEPNCALDGPEFERLAREGATTEPFVRKEGQRVAVFVARLIAWKGLALAVESLAFAPDWKIVVFGDGPERAPVEEIAARLGVSDRVEFRGRVDRSVVFSAFLHADAMFFPTFHDSGPWAAGEASSLGCPVLCLDVGGAAALAAKNAVVVSIDPADTLPERLADELVRLAGRGDPHDRWWASRLPALLQRWYDPDVDEDIDLTADLGSSEQQRA